MAQQNLFTEKQVRQAMQKARYAFNTDKDHDEILKSLPPIEIPSDKEIEDEFAPANVIIDEPTYTFIEGAKWMKKEILNQTK